MFTLPQVPGGLVSVGRTGKVQLRSEVSAGRVWRETWPPMKASGADAQALFTFVENAYNTGATFNLVHYLLPGSGLAPNGAGGGTPLVAGASQSGTTLNTNGWTPSTSGVVKTGDCIKIGGLNQLFRVTADASSTTGGTAALSINPPILAGSSPTDATGITTTGCKLRAFVAAYSPLPEAGPDEIIGGFSVTFREAP